MLQGLLGDVGSPKEGERHGPCLPPVAKPGGLSDAVIRSAVSPGLPWSSLPIVSSLEVGLDWRFRDAASQSGVSTKRKK